MPLYDYRCPAGHETTKLRRWEERHEPVMCEHKIADVANQFAGVAAMMPNAAMKICGKPMELLFPIPHVLPDGVYSYAPPIGTMDAFDRKMAKIDRMKEHKKDTGKVKLVDEV
jgi:hypothetical protein